MLISCFTLISLVVHGITRRPSSAREAAFDPSGNAMMLRMNASHLAPEGDDRKASNQIENLAMAAQIWEASFESGGSPVMLDKNASRLPPEGDDRKASSQLEKLAMTAQTYKRNKKGLNTSISKPVQASHEERVSNQLQHAKSTMRKQSLAEVDSNAVCNDGTPGLYYIKEGKLPANSKLKAKYSSIWLVYLQGGGWCHNEASCAWRCDREHTGALKWVNHMCTSKHDKDTLDRAGIFTDSGNPALENANKVFVRYCTSDAHMGDATWMKWQFRGKVVVQAVMKDLVERYKLGGGSGRELLIFGGGSAGARGAMVHIDYLPEMIGPAAANLEIKGFLDSPCWIDMPTFAPDKNTPLQDITKAVLENTNVDHLGEGPEGCKEKHPDDLWKCMFGEYRLQTLKTSFFLVASQYDRIFFRMMGFKSDTDAKREFAMKYAARTRDLMEQIVNMPQSRNAVFAWACSSHANSESDKGFYEMTCDPDGTSMSSAFQQFLGVMNPTNPKLMWIDRCTTYNCGSGCSPSATQPFQTQWFQTLWFKIVVTFLCCLVMILAFSWCFMRWRDGSC